MKLIKREELDEQEILGRRLQPAVGFGMYSGSNKMTVGFATYTDEDSEMEPHCHAEEAIYVISAEKAWFMYGPDKDSMSIKIELKEGRILHFAENEWHTFGCLKGGHADLIFFYGQADRRGLDGSEQVTKRAMRDEMGKKGGKEKSETRSTRRVRRKGMRVRAR